MEVLAEQAPQQSGALEDWLVDLERKISAGEKFFTRQEAKTGQENTQIPPETANRPAGTAAEDGKQTVFYLIDEVGESDCIYRYRPLSDYFTDDPSNEEMMRSPEIRMPFNLVAIRTRYSYYICRPGDLGIDAGTTLPDYVETFSQTVGYYNEYLKNTGFPAFYHKLQPYDMKPNDAAIFRARQASLKGENAGKTFEAEDDLPEVRPSFSELDVMRFICHGITPEEAADREFADESIIDEYRTRKSETAMVQRLTRDPNLVTAEERALWDAVASQPNDARTLTVTFHFRGRIESLQIKPEAIREVILNRVSFKPADISPSSRSDFFAMGAAPWSNGEKSTLTYEHITKISYWDTVLYDRKAAEQKEKDADIGPVSSAPDEERNAEELSINNRARSPLRRR